jgi:type I restriction enzyme S subunit
MPTSDVTPRGLAKASAILCSGVGLGGDVLVIRPDRAKVDPRFLAYAIRHDANQVLGLVRGSTVYHLYAADMRHFELPSLPIAEQARAADALKDADELIDALEGVIAKKQAIKQGLMQQLLTGRTRLPGFSQAWGSTQLGEHFEITSSKRVFQRDWRSSGVPFYRARELAVLGETGSVNNDLFIDRDLFQKYRRLHGAPSVGDLLVTGVGTLGKTYVVRHGDEFYFKDGNIIWLKRSETIYSNFLEYLFQTPEVQNQVHGESAGTTVGTYTITNAKRTRVPLVPIEEQHAIAALLRNVDLELTALRSRLGKACDIKIGMMQQLLTGRTRLPIAGAAE